MKGFTIPAVHHFTRRWRRPCPSTQVEAGSEFQKKNKYLSEIFDLEKYFLPFLSEDDNVFCEKENHRITE